MIPARPYVVTVYEGHSPRRAEAFATKPEAEDYEVVAKRNAGTTHTATRFVLDDDGSSIRL